ncbi:MAG: leucyl/phenylalanyl-tRNA--protein transferase [Chloroflexota bacterium]
MQLTPTLLLIAYSQGIFPMANRAGGVDWFDPDPRAILPLDDSFHIPRSLARALKRNPFEIKVDTAFREVMLACAQLAPGREATWIGDEFIEAYSQLHRLGFAHSVESWFDGKLVGGLYGVSLGGLFAGESMFSRVKDASKVALAHLTNRLRAGGFVLHDVQMMTPHLQRFGAILIPREEYKARLAGALRMNATF